MVFLSKKEMEMEKEAILNEVKADVLVNIQALLDKIDVLEKRINKLENREFSELMKELPSSITEGIVKAKIEEILIKNSDRILQELKERIQDTVADYEKSIITLKTHLQNLITEYQEIPKKVKETSEKLEELANDFERYWKTADHRMRTFGEEFNNLVKEISSLKEGKNDELLESLSVLRDRIDEFENRINEITSQMEKISKTLAEIMYKIDRLNIPQSVEKGIEPELEKEIKEEEKKKKGKKKVEEETIEVDPDKLDDIEEL